MAIRSNHYDAAFEAYLRCRRIPYIAVDETRRALAGEVSLKSPDFIVHSSRPPNLVVDVKGRRFPSGDPQHGHRWENWAESDDLTSLARWESVFGPGFRAVLVFAYHIVSARALGEFRELFRFGDRAYAFFGVFADDYARSLKTRSPSWQTVSVPGRTYRDLRRPIAELIRGGTGPDCSPAEAPLHHEECTS